MHVTWVPVPVYYHGGYLSGYKIEARKANGTLIGAWKQPADSRNATIIAIKPEDGINCVAVYGYTMYGDGVSSNCVIEEKGTCSR